MYETIGTVECPSCQNAMKVSFALLRDDGKSLVFFCLCEVCVGEGDVRTSRATIALDGITHYEASRSIPLFQD